MTLRKQFFILGTLITLIPILSAVHVTISRFLRSPEKALLTGTDQIISMKNKNYTSDEMDLILNTIRQFPLDVEFIVIDDNSNILLTNSPNPHLKENLATETIYNYIRNTSDQYFYQFNSLQLADSRLSFISRIPVQAKRPGTMIRKMPDIITFLFIIVLILIFMLIMIFTGINKSITQLRNKTKEIAEGNLSEPENIKNSIKTNEITQITDNLEKMRIALLEAQNRKDKLIMGISHDLRTPIAILKGYTEALQDDVITDPAEIKQTLDLIQLKTNQLESIIDTLINFVKLDRFESQENQCCQSITRLIKDFVIESENNGSVFQRKITSDLQLNEEYYTCFNSKLVTRAFENIFSNALRYTKCGDEIHFKAYYDNKTVYFSIKDTGCGIAKEDLPNIFDMFYRASSSRREEGFGIGLSIVQNVISTHKWKINVESEVGVGSIFTIEIPITCCD